MDALLFLTPAFVLSALLILTHTYLGLHVLERGIIFVDIALAQVAALGASVAFLFGESVHNIRGQIYSFAFTLITAIAFAQLRRIADKTWREVTIGCVYVVATALSIVVLSRSVAGMEELKSLFNGSMLWTRWTDIAVVAMIYLAAALIFSIGHKHFRKLSSLDRTSRQDQDGVRSTAWEYVFFICFAVIITTAVQHAGILVVFAFLIIPAFGASLLAGSWQTRLVLGWALGLGGSAVGLFVAYFGDLPVGATVVSTLGLIPIFMGILRYVRQKKAG